MSYLHRKFKNIDPILMNCLELIKVSDRNQGILEGLDIFFFEIIKIYVQILMDELMNIISIFYWSYFI